MIELEEPVDIDPPGVLWDRRVGVYRAPAMLYERIRAGLMQAGFALSDAVAAAGEHPGAWLPLELRPYQEAAIDAWELQGRRGLVVLPTGSGKTHVALAVMARTGMRTLCLVPTRALLEQWTTQIARRYQGAVGCYGDGRHELAPVTVATFESAYRHMDQLGNRFELLIVDEAHHFGSGVRDEALEMSIASARLGLTATPPTGDTAPRLGDLLGPRVYELAIGDLSGTFLASFDLITLPLQLGVAERMLYDRQRAQFRDVHREFLRTTPDGRWSDFVAMASRTASGRAALAAWRESQQILTYPVSKRRAVALLLARHRASRVLVFTADNETAYEIARQHLVMPLTCDIDRRERTAALARFQDGTLHALVSARCSTRGSTCPTRTSPSWSAERRASASMSSAWVGSSGLEPESGRSSTNWSAKGPRRRDRQKGGRGPLLPRSLLSYSVRDGLIIPRFLGASDMPWLRLLIDEVERFTGRREAELDERLRSMVVDGVDARSHRLAAAVLRRTLAATVRCAVQPKKARAALFTAAARMDIPRDAVLRHVASELEISVDDLEQALFGDLPGERILTLREAIISPTELVLRANLALARGFLERACVISIALEGNARAIVRQAKLRRLICGVRPLSTDGAILDVSGPFALFRHTLIYGRALGELLPLLAWCRRFRLEATCVLGDRALPLRLASGDPIFPSAEPRRFDSRVEERFFRDFTRLAPAWDVIREPEPVQAGAWLLFPDFALKHRHDPERRWLVEIVGFWTERYLERKVASYRAANIDNLILCVSDDLACNAAAFPPGARVIRYRRAVDPASVLAIVDPHEAPSARSSSL